MSIFLAVCKLMFFGTAIQLMVNAIDRHIGRMIKYAKWISIGGLIVSSTLFQDFLSVSRDLHDLVKALINFFRNPTIKFWD